MALEQAAAARLVQRSLFVAAIGLVIAAIAVVLSATATTSVAVRTSTATTLEPPACRRDPGAATFQVCVVDEAGRPLAGVAVFAAHTLYSGSGPYTGHAGVATTDANGLATFERRPIPGSTVPRPLWATARREGWPEQAERTPGTIVLGPPRTLRAVVRFAKPCTNPRARLHVHNHWDRDPTAFLAPAPWHSFADADADHSFTIANLGPGDYRVSVYACDDDAPQAWSGDIRVSELAGRTLELPLELRVRPER